MWGAACSQEGSEPEWGLRSAEILQSPGLRSWQTHRWGHPRTAEDWCPCHISALCFSHHLLNGSRREPPKT